MHILFVIGRSLFSLIFIVSGAQKLMDVAGTATMIASKVAIPAALNSIVAQIENATGMTTPQLLAVASGMIELAGGLLIAFNIGTSGVAFLLLLFTAAATYYFHDFWNMTGSDHAANVIHALKNLSIIGALMVFMSLGSSRPAKAEALHDL